MDSAAGPVKHQRLTTANNRAGFMDIAFLQTGSGIFPEPSQRANRRQHNIPLDERNQTASPVWVRPGHSAMSAQCPVCPKADKAGRFMSTALIMPPAKGE